MDPQCLCVTLWNIGVGQVRQSSECESPPPQVQLRGPTPTANPQTPNPKEVFPCLRYCKFGNFRFGFNFAYFDDIMSHIK